MERDAPRAEFRAITASTASDWALIGEQFLEYARHLPDRVLKHLRLLEGDYGGFPVDRLEHCLQCATRAHRDGRDEPYVVMALLHDIGDTLGTFNHSEIAAAILQPFVSEELHWIAAKHGIFQGYYYFQHVGLDRDMRETWRDHPHFAACAEFCEKYDQNAFDADYQSEPLVFFEPTLRRVMSRPVNSPFSRFTE